jgi:uncharacterized protein (DUF433 family)
MPTLTNIDQFIATQVGVCGGRPCIAGSRITVQHIITEIKVGHSPAAILADKPHLSLASIHAAISYYYANQTALDQAFADDDAASGRLAQDIMETLKTQA